MNAATRKPRWRVLVVEDNPVNQDLVLDLLEDSEYAVTLAGNGRLCIESFERERFDVVLMDWQMPELDGVEATRLIRQLERTRGLPRTPIIGLTAYAMPGDRETCLAAGMDDYITKPYSLDTLLSALKRWTEPASKP